MDEIKVLDVVALKENLPDHGLRQGEVGTIVERWNDGEYEVEFSDDSGEAYAFVALQSSQLLKLYFQKFVRLEPPIINAKARQFLDEGFGFFNKGDEVQAESKLRQAIALDPRSRGAILNSILKSFENKDDWGARIQALRFLYHLAPEYKYGRNNLAITYLNYGVEKAKQGETDTAMTLFSYAITLNVASEIEWKVRENYAGCITTLGIKNHKDGDFLNAVAAMRVACMIFPHVKTRHNLGLAHAHLALYYMNRAQYEKAIPVFEEAEEAGLILPELLNDYAIALVFENREDEAKLAFVRALSLSPESNLIKENLTKLSRRDSKTLVQDVVKAQYIPIQMSAYHYQLAA